MASQISIKPFLLTQQEDGNDREQEVTAVHFYGYPITVLVRCLASHICVGGCLTKVVKKVANHSRTGGI